ncbi:MAG: hypothetical protein GTO18_21425 [Anaerolineales bacterium]|nr:hypothetical protein [Anaerolineales bacterium]
MATKSIAAEVYTSSHRILGRIFPGGPGLYSFLNIPTTSYVEMEGAILSRLHQPNRLIARYQTLWLVKHEIAAILLSSKVEIGPTGVSRSGYIGRESQWVHVVLGGYELRGVVESSGKFNFASMMFEGETIFLPLYDAELTAILFPKIQAEAPAMLFNRNMVDAMGLMPRREIPEEALEEE